MTCTCKAELAKIVREVVISDPFASGGMLFGKLANALEELSPPPSAPELAGWRAKCDITEYDHGWYVDTGWRGPRPLLFLGKEGHWGAAEDVAYFPTRAAAVAALNAASEPPGCVEDKPKPKTTDEPCPTCTDKNAQWGLGAIDHPESRMAGGRPWSECSDCNGTGYVLKNPREAWSFVEETPAPTTGTTNTRPFAAVVADGKAASGQPFDADTVAAAMFKHNKVRGDLNISQHDGSRGYSVIISEKDDAERAKQCWRDYIAAALRAAHAAGAASAKEARP